MVAATETGWGWWGDRLALWAQGSPAQPPEHSAGPILGPASLPHLRVIFLDAMD